MYEVKRALRRLCIGGKKGRKAHVYSTEPMENVREGMLHFMIIRITVIPFV